MKRDREEGVTHVIICVAVADDGRVDCIPYQDWHLQLQLKHDDFLKAKRLDEKHIWAISYLQAYVPVPEHPLITAEVSDTPQP